MIGQSGLFLSILYSRSIKYEIVHISFDLLILHYLVLHRLPLSCINDLPLIIF